MTAAARLDLRLNPTDKDRIARAAELRGMPVSAFVRDAVLREVDNVMTADLTVTLSAKESRRFLDALDKPFKPNARLKQAMQRGLSVTLANKVAGPNKASLATRLRGRATTRLSTEQIMRLTRGA